MGIAPKIVRWLQQPQLLEAFCQKEKMRSLMQSIPIRVILNDRAALYGPAIYLLNHVLEKKKG
jgi:glucokinase